MLALRNERRVRGMIRMEELGSMRERIGTVDVAEGLAQYERCQQGEHGGADEKAPHDREVYASSALGSDGYFTELIPR